MRTLDQNELWHPNPQIHLGKISRTNRRYGLIECRSRLSVSTHRAPRHRTYRIGRAR